MDQQEHIAESRGKLLHEKLYILFGGGVGKFGTNLSIITYNGLTLWIDAGSGFPDYDQPGATKILPDISLIEEYHPHIIILTHGHEDHIGAIPYLSKFFRKPVTIYLAPFTRELLEFKLNDAKSPSKNFKFINIESNETIKQDKIEFNFFFMPHSIPHTFSVGINFKDIQRKLYFTSDFKLKGNEPRYRSEDIKKYGPVDYLLIDSTGSLSSGSTIAESDTFDSFRKEINEWPGRIFITLFSSQIERIREIFKIAEDSGREVGIMGFSIKVHLNLAYSVGEFHIPPEQLHNPSPRSKRAIWIVSGCQANKDSSFYRLAYGQKNNFSLKKTDLFIYSASIIPGNESNVYDCLNHISSFETRIIGLSSNDGVFHTSGHGKQEDLQTMISWLKPRHIIPVHGDPLHFNSFCKFISEPSILHQLDGSRIYELGENVIPSIKHHGTFTYADGSLMHKDQTVFSQRRSTSTNGLVALVLLNKTIISSIKQVGLIPSDQWESFEKRIKIDLDKYIKEISGEIDHLFEKKIRQYLQREIKNKYQKSPYVLLTQVFSNCSNG